MRAIPAGFVHADRQILAHPVHREAEIELALRHGLPAVFHLPGLGSTLRKRLHHGRDVEPGHLREVDRLGQALDDAGDADLVHHLGELARTRGAEQLHRARIAGDNKLGLGERLWVAAHHHREHAVLRTRLAAGNRGVEEMRGAGSGGGMKFAGNVSGGGRVVDEDRAGLEAQEGALVAGGDLAQIAVVAHAAEYEIRVPRGLLRRRRHLPAELGNPGLRLAGCAIIDGEIVPALGADMPGHGIAHDAQPNKRNFAHRAPPTVADISLASPAG